MMRCSRGGNMMRSWKMYKVVEDLVQNKSAIEED